MAKEQLRNAAQLFKKAGGEMEGWWTVAGKIWSDEKAQVKATADPKTRREFTEYVKRSKELDSQAADVMDEALSVLNR